MKYAIMALLAMVVGSAVRSDRIESNSAASRPKGKAAALDLGFASAATIPFNRSFRCPVTLSASTSATASTMVPNDIGFVLTSLTFAGANGAESSGQFENRVRITAGLCTEVHVVPQSIGNGAASTLAGVGLDGRRLAFDPPLLLQPGDPLSFELFRVYIPTQADSPLQGQTSVSLVIGGYVLYPGEF